MTNKDHFNGEGIKKQLINDGTIEFHGRKEKGTKIIISVRDADTGEVLVETDRVSAAIVFTRHEDREEDGNAVMLLGPVDLICMIAVTCAKYLRQALERKGILKICEDAKKEFEMETF